jgi:hypothetical protein
LIKEEGMFKKLIVVSFVLFPLLLGCSKKNITTNNYYSTPGEGRIVGYVYPYETSTEVIGYLGSEISTTHLDTAGYFELSHLPAGGYTILVRSEEYRDYRTYVWVSGAGTVSLDTIFLVSVHDLVANAYPVDGAVDVRLQDRITIVFRDQMNPSSVENAFHVEPEVDGNFYWSGGGKAMQLQFIPLNLFAVSTTYRVTLDTTASDVDGIKLSAPYRFSFTTESIRIQTYPQNKETWVDPSTPIYIYFNTPMDEESVVLAFKMVDSNFHDVTGKFDWGYLQNLAFLPDTSLAFGETYTVTIDTNAKALSGGSLEEPYNFWFKTRPY